MIMFFKRNQFYLIAIILGVSFSCEKPQEKEESTSTLKEAFQNKTEGEEFTIIITIKE